MERGKPTNDHKLIAVPPQRCAATQSAGCGGGDAIGAEFAGKVERGWIVPGGTSGTFTIVEFDISVVAETGIQDF